MLSTLLNYLLYFCIFLVLVYLGLFLFGYFQLRKSRALFKKNNYFHGYDIADVLAQVGEPNKIYKNHGEKNTYIWGGKDRGDYIYTENGKVIAGHFIPVPKDFILNYFLNNKENIIGMYDQEIIHQVGPPDKGANFDHGREFDTWNIDHGGEITIEKQNGRCEKIIIKSGMPPRSQTS